MKPVPHYRGRQERRVWGLIDDTRLNSAALRKVERFGESLNQVVPLQAPRNSDGVTNSIVCGVVFKIAAKTRLLNS